jgi:5-(carboxyamino)imidazole ribonucleotide mutase
MGSDSDLPVMAEAARHLKRLEVAYELHVTSAHRTPERTVEIVRDAAARGVQVFIAGAGGAAHLAGAVAAQTTLPVLGVPLASSELKGLDALLATVQMPAGIAVGTLAIGPAGAANAAILAAAILALSDSRTRAPPPAARSLPCSRHRRAW